jgi:cytochrome c
MRGNGLAVVVAGGLSLTCTAAIATSLVATPSSAAAPSALQATSAPGSSAGSGNPPAGLEDAKASDCFACHAIDHKVVGPAYDAVARRYAGQGDAVVDKLADKVIDGGSGNWGTIAMTPHPDLGKAKARTIVRWILSLKPAAATASATAASSAPAPASASASGSGQAYTYKTPDGKTVTLDFRVFAPNAPKKEVTKAIFTGYEQYNSTCNRCHGDDAVGGAYAAPDLRHSLASGFTWQQFLATAMAGRQDKGMPSWAGFYTPAEIRDIYEYVKAREVGLIESGRPPSAQD